MIHEYFIEPKLIYKWALCPRDSRFFLDEIGVGHPRLLSSFPCSKATKLRSFLLRGIPIDMPEVARIRIDELVNALTNEVITRTVTENLPGDWCEAAKKESGITAPSVIISSEGNYHIDFWITEEDAYKRDSHFNHPRQLTPERTLEAFTNTVKNLLRYSNKIVLVDRYLGKTLGMNTVRAFIKEALSEKINQTEVEIQLLFDSSKYAATHIKKQLASLEADFSFKLSVLGICEKLEGEKLHNRYLLTELGGVSFGVGTDASKDYHTDDLFLLDKEIYTKRWNQYLNAAAFDIKQQLIKNI
jgi:hypothetical protein